MSEIIHMNMDWSAPLRFVLNTIIGIPPSREVVYRDYNRIRQIYIEKAVAQHFGKRHDDPAPLFGKTVLDVGCGSSTISSFLVLSGGEVVAIDIDQESLKQAESQAKFYGASVNFLQAQPEDLLHDHKKFDVILCLDIFEHIADLDKFLWTLDKLLEPNGVLVFSAINRTPKAWFLHIFLSAYVYGRTKPRERSYKRFYTPKQLEEKLKKHKISISGVQGLKYDNHKNRWNTHEKPDTRYMVTARRG